MTALMRRLNPEYQPVGDYQPAGDYVLRSDYDALAKRVAALESTEADRWAITTSSPTSSLANCTVRMIKVGRVVFCSVTNLSSAALNATTTICTIPTGFRPSGSRWTNWHYDYTNPSGKHYRVNIITTTGVMSVHVYTATGDENTNLVLSWIAA